MFAQKIAIDLGTANTIIIVDGQIVVDEPSVVAKLLSDKMTIDFHVAEDPLHSVAKGTGIALQNINNFSFLMNGN